MKLKKYLIFLFVSLILLGCSDDNVKDGDKVIAEIGDDYKVTLNDLNKYIADWHYDRRFRKPNIVYNKALDDLLTNQLKRFDLFDRKLNENKELMKEVSRYVNNEIIAQYYEEEFVKKYVNDQKAAEAYKEMDKEIICYDVLLPVSENLSKEKEDSLKTVALEIEQKLRSTTIEQNIKNNTEVKELLKPYSSKYSITANLNKVTWAQSLTDPAANVAFQLQPGDSRVVYASDGFHVVKVVDINKIELQPFEDLKEKILADLKKGYYFVFNQEYENYRNSFIDRSSIKWNNEALQKIIDWSNTDKFFATAYKDTLQNAIDNGQNFEILSYNTGAIDLKDFLDLLNEVIILYPDITLNSQTIKDFILDGVYDSFIIKEALKKGVDEKVITPYTESNIIKSRLIYVYNQAVIDASIPEATPEVLKNFYEEQRDSIFYQLKKVNIYTRIYSDSAKAVAEIEKINNGTPFEKVSDRWFVKTYIRERDGSLESFASKEPPYLAEATFKLDLNEVAGPVAYYDSTKGKQYAVIKAINIRPEKQLTYEDVKGERLKEEFENYHRQNISKEIEAKLKEKYDIEIHEDVLSEAIATAKRNGLF